nr:hypothetical protein [Staphylococcus epidermidis]
MVDVEEVEENDDGVVEVGLKMEYDERIMDVSNEGVSFVIVWLVF